MGTVMTLCPNCRLIRKVGEICCCGYPVTMPIGQHEEQQASKDKETPPVLSKPEPLGQWWPEI